MLTQLMETGEILLRFEHTAGKFERAAVEAAVARREEVTPELLRMPGERCPLGSLMQKAATWATCIPRPAGAVPGGSGLPSCSPVCFASRGSPGFTLR